MTMVLPKSFENWARAEVAAGRAVSVEALAQAALDDHQRRVEAFRQSLRQAVSEAERDGWIEGEAVLAEMDALIDKFERDAAEPARG
jgi:hypothetical protein